VLVHEVRDLALAAVIKFIGFEVEAIDRASERIA